VSESSTTIDVAEEMSSNVSRHNYRISVKNSSGEPVSGQEVIIAKTGDGSFAPNFRSDEIRRTTNDAGEAVFIWYRGGVFTRRVKATITLTAAEGQTISAERYEDTSADVGISYIERPFKLPPQRV
jgi:hypothetical protein